jgi:hypothetical protein
MITYLDRYSTAEKDPKLARAYAGEEIARIKTEPARVTSAISFIKLVPEGTDRDALVLRAITARQGGGKSVSSGTKYWLNELATLLSPQTQPAARTRLEKLTVLADRSPPPSFAQMDYRGAR